MPEETKTVPDPSTLTTEQLLREVDRVKELMMSELKGMYAIFEERFASVATQLALIERQRIEQKKDTKDAVDAALAAAKEAVKEQTASSEKSITKSETATAEQLKQQSATFSTAVEGAKQSIDDIKERVGKIENVKTGRTESREGIYAAIAAVGGILALIIWASGSGAFN